jgi:adenylylsulfate kinase
MQTESDKNNNLTWHDGYITREDREKLHGHKGAVVWFTGLSASGKSTIAEHLEKLLYERGCSTYVFDRNRIRDLVGSDRFFEIYVHCPVEVCAQRDPKGIYAKAKAGIIKEFTGISAPYEPPERASLVICSDRVSAPAAALDVLRILEGAKIV